MPLKQLHTRSPIAALLLAAIVLMLHAFYYYPFFADDALISLRYAERFLAGQGLTWNDGEHVEGYTNLLWTLATAALGALHIDLIIAARLIGVASAATLLSCFYQYARATVTPRDRASILAFAALFVALSPPIAIWLVGGLETLMLAALLAGAITCLLLFIAQQEHSLKRIFYAALFLGALVLTRADAPLLVVSCTLGMFLCMRGNLTYRLRAALLLASIPFACFLAQTGFRLWYYHDLLPNTFYAKFAVSSRRFAEGIAYVKHGLLPFAPVVAVLLASAINRTNILSKTPAPAQVPGRRMLLLLIIALCHCMYLVCTGGDIFPGYRHMVVIIVLGSFLCIDALAAIFRGTTGISPFMHGLLLVGLLWGWQIAHDDPENERAHSELWEWSCKNVAEEMQQKWQQHEPLMAASAAGCMPYFSQFAAVDIFGLNDAFLAKNHGENFGSGFLGHELTNPAYILSRHPDIIVFGDAGLADPMIEFTRYAPFRQQYQLYEIPMPDNQPAYLWLERGFYKKVAPR